MAQNIYDDETFFKGYSALPRSERGLDGAPEWPSLKAMLPALGHKNVTDLGCGFGWFAAHAAASGAASVIAYDISENMLARAREINANPAITYAQADLDQLTLAAGSADLVYSSLAFHYLSDLKRLFAEISKALVAGGNLVFSVEHPMFTSPVTQGWVKDVHGERSWPINNYLNEGARSSDWLAQGVVKQHRTFATYLNLLTANNVRLTHAEEWGPTGAELAANSALADERQRPTFLLISARKNP